MNYVGVDLHKEQSWFYVMNETGKKIDSRSISNSIEVLRGYFETIPKPFTLAVESTFNWYFFVDLAEEYAEKVYLANSYELKAFAKRNKKTDKIDARLIADVMRKGYLPTVTIPGKEIREIKEILRFRMNIVKDRTRNISRLRNILSKLGENPHGDFTTYKKLKEIPMGHLPDSYQEIISGYIEKVGQLHEKLYSTEKYVKEKVIQDEDVVNLTSIPGISYFGAALIKSEIIDIGRFKSFNKLCSYAGLAPRVHQSAERTINGPLNINRRKKLQWILIESVLHFMKSSPERKRKQESITKKKGYNTARVSLARDMLKIIYHVLKEKRPYYIAKPNYYNSVQPGVAPALMCV